LDGEFIPGARNRNLDQPTLVGIDHSEVHAWYFGSIDPEASDDEMAAMILEERLTQAEAFAPLVATEGIPNPLFTAASVSIQRPQWYLDHKGIIEGFSHTRRGGESPHDPAREPLDATPRPNAFHDFIPDGVFNGDFKHGAEQIVDLPGWDRHGGGGEGDLDAGHLRLFENLSTASRYRRHNVMFVPPNAWQLSFRCRVFRADARAIPNTDHLVVRLGNLLVLGGPGNEVWLNQATSTFRRISFDVPAAARGNSTTLTFEIAPGGSVANAEVWIDDITWLDRTYLNLIAARLPSGEVQLSMRGKLLSRYRIEASPDMISWTSVRVVTNLTGSIEITEARESANGRKFYRAVLIP
jgi:hypothetical protein